MNLVNNQALTISNQARRNQTIDNHVPNRVESNLEIFGLKSPINPLTSLGVRNHHATQHWHFLDGQDELTRSFELIKVLRQHQTDKRWTLLIAPSHIPDKSLLDCCSVDMNHVLIVREKQITSMFDTIEKALVGNTCCAIVAWCSKWHEQLSQTQVLQLSGMASISRCHIYAFNKQANNDSLTANYN